MSPRALKQGYYTLTALSTLASQYYFNYLFFYLQEHYGFDNRTNLWVAALHGAVYVFAAWQGGRFAERFGYVTSLKAGYAGLVASMLAGAAVSTATATMVVLVGYTLVLLLIWPALEALTTADEPPGRVPHMVGIYNLTWSTFAAVAYFTGGPLYARLGPGLIFIIPAGLFLVQLAGVSWLARFAGAVVHRADVPEVVAVPTAPPVELAVHPRRSDTFLRLAWLANPLSYVAIYTLLAVMPGIASRLGLTLTQVGMLCSIWMFARLASFALLWRWTGWHYRFRWLVAGYLCLIGSFVAVLLAPNTLVLAVSQVFFGFGAGVAYYSSLFYSMDLSEAKAEHGGLHEAAIGIGMFAGPAVGAMSLQVFPSYPNAGMMAVTGLLIAGFVGLIGVWRSGRKT
jgi:predicted MFS family arabinose efflux permease